MCNFVVGEKCDRLWARTEQAAVSWLVSLFVCLLALVSHRGELLFVSFVCSTLQYFNIPMMMMMMTVRAISRWTGQLDWWSLFWQTA